MRIVHLIEYEWIDPKDACARNVIDCTPYSGPCVAFKMLGKSTQRLSNENVRQLYKYLRSNGNNPYMTETESGAIRIQYHRWPRGYHYDKIKREMVRDDT